MILEAIKWEIPKLSEEERDAKSEIYPTAMVKDLQMVATPSYSVEEEEAASTTEWKP